jgi:heme exporter protein CcmD
MSSGFWSMGGYAFYVWTSYVAALGVFAWNVVSAHRECLAVMRRVRQDTAESESRP